MRFLIGAILAAVSVLPAVGQKTLKSLKVVKPDLMNAFVYQVWPEEGGLAYLYLEMVDQTRRIALIGMDGKTIRTASAEHIGHKDFWEGEYSFRLPEGLAESGEIQVLCYKAALVQRFTGKPPKVVALSDPFITAAREMWKKSGPKLRDGSPDPHQRVIPSAALDHNGNVYFSVIGQRRMTLLKADPNGKVLGRFVLGGPDDEVILADSLSVYKGLIYVADRAGSVAIYREE